MPELSVVICTHNPRPDFLDRVLASLKAQFLPKARWELLLVDNASRQQLSDRWDLSWHPSGRHISEPELGLTPARMRGIREAQGALLIFLDDDNVPAPDYLETADAVAEKFPELGAFGGSISAEFEEEPPREVRPHLTSLAICEIDRDYWCNHLYQWSLATPYGAGMCVRRAVAQDYLKKVEACRLRRKMDRNGLDLNSHGDTDLAWCSLDLGLGVGRFRSLQLTHLISRERVNPDYIVRLQAGFVASNLIMRFIRFGEKPVERNTILKVCRLILNYAGRSGMERKLLVAKWRSARLARSIIQQEILRRV